MKASNNKTTKIKFLMLGLVALGLAGDQQVLGGSVYEGTNYPQEYNGPIVLNEVNNNDYGDGRSG